MDVTFMRRGRAAEVVWELHVPAHTRNYMVHARIHVGRAGEIKGMF